MTNSSSAIKFKTPCSRRVIVLNSKMCAYCAVLFGPSNLPTIDHVIGRKFVPKNQLSGQWNLHVTACRKCNGEKADLEDDISVISMLATKPNEITDDVLIAEIKRKSGRAISRKTNRSVAHSAENIKLCTTGFGAASYFDFVAPAQIDPHRIERLAWYHIQAFVFFLSYDKKNESGKFLRDEVQILTYSGESNWGSTELRWFTNLTKSWRPILRATAANGYFKIAVRRLHNEKIYSWALEWNRSMRVVGFLGDAKQSHDLSIMMPQAEPTFVHEQGNETVVVREEVSLPVEEDFLFSWDDFMNSDDQIAEEAVPVDTTSRNESAL